MNERIQELISAYLHRGSTPEQERQLFEACSRNPETAELLRQHLILSLKLHTLRDAVEVPSEVHNGLLRRINAMEAENAAAATRAQSAVQRTPSPSTAVHTSAPGPTPRRFGWTHLFGTGLAGAAAVLLLSFWMDSPAPDSARSPISLSHDTVMVLRTDTLTRVREIERPVYIVRGPATTADETQVSAILPPEGNDAGRVSPTAGDATPTTVDASPATVDASPTTLDAASISENNTPLSAAVEDNTGMAVADARAASPRVEKTQNFLAQYNSMLVSVESVSLSTKDRLH